MNRSTRTSTRYGLTFPCLAFSGLVACGGGGSAGVADDPCQPTDADGISGGLYTFALTVDDNGFTPRILKSQNMGDITLTVTNAGTKPHDFVVDCIPTDTPGCARTSCFPASATVSALAPGDSATRKFTVPFVEGIYTFRSDVSDDSNPDADGGVSGIWGQYVVQ